MAYLCICLTRLIRVLVTTPCLRLQDQETIDGAVEVLNTSM